MIHLGDHMKRKLKIYDAAFGKAPTEQTVDATVVYIHPQRRFCVLQFDLGSGRSFRESEPFPAEVRERYTN